MRTVNKIVVCIEEVRWGEYVHRFRLQKNSNGQNKKKKMQRAASCIAEWFVSTPLRALFNKGPAWLGGWHGRNEADMCAEMTGSPATFWIMHADECGDIVENKFQSFQIVVHIVVYGYLLISVVSLLVRACIFRWTVVGPVERMLRSVVAASSALSTTPHNADKCIALTFPRRQNEAARSPRKFLSTDTWHTAPKKNGPPH